MIFFFFNDTATTEIYTLSLHDALPISRPRRHGAGGGAGAGRRARRARRERAAVAAGGGMTTHRADVVVAGAGHNALICRSEEHTSELQSRQYLVCRLLLEKKKQR